MVDRTKLANGKSSMLMCPVDYAPASFEDFIADLKAGVVYVDITPNNDLEENPGVSEVGTPLNKVNLLSDTTADKLGLTDNSTPDKALEKLADLNISKSVTLTVAGWVSSGGRFTQTVNVTGVKTTVAPDVKGIVYPNGCTDATRRAIQRAASFIVAIDTGNGTITFTATLKPSVDITLGIGV